jgi:hypothetical protein
MRLVGVNFLEKHISLDFKRQSFLSSSEKIEIKTKNEFAILVVDFHIIFVMYGTSDKSFTGRRD